MSDLELERTIIERLDYIKQSVWDRMAALEERMTQLEGRVARAEEICAQRRDRGEQESIQASQSIGRVFREVDGLRAQLHNVAEQVVHIKMNEPLPPIVINPTADLMAQLQDNENKRKKGKQ
jgi:hypothetical protein